MRDSAYIWDEISVPVRCNDDRGRAEAINLESTRRHALDATMTGTEVARSREQRFDLRPLDLQPRGYYRLRSH